MTRAELAANIFTQLRREQNPPLTRYAILTFVALHPGMTVAELSKKIGDDSAYISSPLQFCVRRAWVLSDHKKRYRITPEGEDVIRRFIQPEINEANYKGIARQAKIEKRAVINARSDG